MRLSQPLIPALELATAVTMLRIVGTEISDEIPCAALISCGAFYLTKSFRVRERVKLRLDGQFFDIFNHPNFGLPSMVLAGIPGKPSTQTGFGALTYTTSPPTGLLGVGLGGDSSRA